MIAKTYDLIGVGVSAVDDVLTIAAYPPANVKVPVLDSNRHGGGLACTATAAAATLGGRVAFIARFGDDERSRYVCDILSTRGVDVSHMVHDSEGQPYHSLVFVDAAGDRTVFYDKRRVRALRAADLSDEVLSSARVLLVDFLDPPGPLELVLKARRLGVPVVADFEGQLPAAAELVNHVDHLVVPEEFARWCTGQEDLGRACAALARTPRACTVVTAGARGCWWTQSASVEPVHQPAFTVKTVSTNGCGDTFHGAYALALARNLAPAATVIFASACAAIKAAHSTGGWNALPTMQQVVRFLQDRALAQPELTPVIAALRRTAPPV